MEVQSVVQDFGAGCYGVTTCEPDQTPSYPTVVEEIEAYLHSYVSFTESSQALPIALWLAATHCWPVFDAFPYVVVTSTTKRSGKTRLLELMSFVAANPRTVAHISPAAMYHTIHAEKPTLFVDEAESFSSPISEFRSLLNTGYRRGQKVLRQNGGGTVEYDTYCPKAFALIGDVYDTLRDRSIVIVMRRGTAAKRFVFSAARQEGNTLRDRLREIAETKAAEFYETTVTFEGLPFLTDRDEEIWTPIFVMCSVLCPDRLEELTRAAVDIATAKTADAKKFTQLAGQEKEVEEQEYAERLLLDAIQVLGARKHITTAELIPALRAIPTSPWRKFRGTGLKDGIDGAMDVAALLNRYGVKPKTIRIANKGEKKSTAKGYEFQTLVRAAEVAGVLGRNPVTSEPIASRPQADEAAVTESVSIAEQALPPDHAKGATAVAAAPVQDSRLNPQKRYTVRPAPQGGFGVYGVGGSTACLEWFATEEDAWDAAYCR